MSNYNVREIKRELEDYYGTAMTHPFLHMAIMNLGGLDNLSDDQLVELAKKVGIDVEKYNEDYER